MYAAAIYTSMHAPQTHSVLSLQVRAVCRRMYLAGGSKIPSSCVAVSRVLPRTQLGYLRAGGSHRTAFCQMAISVKVGTEPERDEYGFHRHHAAVTRSRPPWESAKFVSCNSAFALSLRYVCMFLL